MLKIGGLKIGGLKIGGLKSVVWTAALTNTTLEEIYLCGVWAKSESIPSSGNNIIV